MILIDVTAQPNDIEILGAERAGELRARVVVPSDSASASSLDVVEP